MSGERTDKAVIDKSLKDKIVAGNIALIPTQDGIVKDIYNGRWYMKFNGSKEVTEDGKKIQVGDPYKIYMADITKEVQLQVANGNLDESVWEQFNYSHAIWKESGRIPVGPGGAKTLADLSKDPYNISGGEDIKVAKVDKTHYSIQANIGTTINPIWQDVKDENGKIVFDETKYFPTVYKLLLEAATPSEVGQSNMGKSPASVLQ